MAVVVTARTAADQALMAADKCVLVGSNELRPTSLTSSQWRQGGSWAAGSDETASAGPTKCVGDGFTGRKTYPATAQTTWYLLFQWTTAVAFDCIAIIGHNFGTITGLTACQLQVADNNAFSTNLRTIASFTPGVSNKRLVSLALTETTGSNIYSGVQFARIKLTKGSAFTPQIGEIVLGTQRQLSYKPDNPYDDYGQRSRVDRSESLVGVIAGATRFTRRRELNAHIALQDATEATKIKNWWADSAGGTKPFLWVDDPTSNPQGASMVVLEDPAADIPYEEAQLRSYDIEDAHEQGPDFAALES